MANVKTEKVIITCAVTGAVHTPTSPTPCPSRRTQIAAGLDRRGRGGRLDPAPARARSEGRPADARPRYVHAVPAAHQTRRATR